MSVPKVSVYWDIENCGVPATSSGGAAARYIEKVALEHGICVSFRAYVSSDGIVAAKRPDLLASGVSLIPTKPKCADHVMITDLLTWAWDNPSGSTVVLVTGDTDFSYTLSILRRRKVKVVLIAPAAAYPTLTSQASHVVEWMTSAQSPPVKGDARRKVTAAHTGLYLFPDNYSTHSEPVELRSAATMYREDNALPSTSRPLETPAVSAPSPTCTPSAPSVPLMTETSSCFPATKSSAQVARDEGWITGDDLRDIANAQPPTSDPLPKDPSAVHDIDPALIPLPRTPVLEARELPVESTVSVHVLSSPRPSTTPLFPPGLEHHIPGAQLSHPPPSDPTLHRRNGHVSTRQESQEADADDAWLQPVSSKPHRLDVNHEGYLSVHAPAFVPRPSSDSWRARAVPPSKQTPGRSVPPQFKPLVEALERLEESGVRKPLWSAVGGQLQHCRTAVFRQTGVTSMKDYLHAARAAGICQVGEVNIAKGAEWVQLSIRRMPLQRASG